MEYRIREARVTVSRPYSSCTERRFIAERRVTLLDIRVLEFGFWWPVINAEWRKHEIHARSDMENDIEMRLPLNVRYFEVRK